MEEYSRYDGYRYDSNGDYINEANDTKKKYNTSKAIILLAGFFLFTEIIISIAAVTPPMLKIFPRYLIVSIGLCLMSFAGYIGATIFGCRRLMRRMPIKDFLKVAYPAYSVVIIASILPRLISFIIRIPALDDLTKNLIVWLFAPMRLFRMFGLNNFYSITISHIAVVSAITVTYLFARRKEEEKKGNIRSRKTRIIKKKKPDARKIRRKKTKVKEKKLTKRKSKRVNIFSLLSSKKSGHKRHKLNLSGSRRKPRKAKYNGARKRNLGSMMRKIENFSKNKYR